jgi:hypothetical protein
MTIVRVANRKCLTGKKSSGIKSAIGPSIAGD